MSMEQWIDEAFSTGIVEYSDSCPLLTDVKTSGKLIETRLMICFSEIPIIFEILHKYPQIIKHIDFNLLDGFIIFQAVDNKIIPESVLYKEPIVFENYLLNEPELVTRSKLITQFYESYSGDDLLERRKLPGFGDPEDIAISKDDVDFLKEKFADPSCDPDLLTLDLIIQWNAIKCFRFALINGVEPCENDFYIAIAAGRTEMIAIFEQEGYPFPEYTNIIAGTYWRNNIIDWLDETNRSKELMSSFLIDTIILLQRRNFQFLRYLKEKSILYCRGVFLEALEYAPDFAIEMIDKGWVNLSGLEIVFQVLPLKYCRMVKVLVPNDCIKFALSRKVFDLEIAEFALSFLTDQPKLVSPYTVCKTPEALKFYIDHNGFFPDPYIEKLHNINDEKLMLAMSKGLNLNDPQNWISALHNPNDIDTLLKYGVDVKTHARRVFVNSKDGHIIEKLQVVEHLANIFGLIFENGHFLFTL